MFERKNHTCNVVVFEVHLSGTGLNWHGSHFREQNAQELKAKFEQQKVNIRDILKMNLKRLKQS